MDVQIRLNKHLALQLGISRREADILIGQQRVTINGTIAELGSRVEPDDQIAVNKKPLEHTNRAFVYILLHKPIGYVCSRREQGNTPTIYSIIPPEYHQLKTVGRLDANSSGLILLTNDGDFAHCMTHPKFHKVKIYEVSLDSDLAPLHQQMISEFGIDLEDGRSKLPLTRLSETNRRDWQVTMSEGRNRQIRRTFAALGYGVKRLHRTNFGNYSLGDTKAGSMRVVSKQ